MTVYLRDALHVVIVALIRPLRGLHFETLYPRRRFVGSKPMSDQRLRDGSGWSAGEPLFG